MYVCICHVCLCMYVCIVYFCMYMYVYVCMEVFINTRLASYLVTNTHTYIHFCIGTVLANEEVINGLSERGSTWFLFWKWPTHINTYIHKYIHRQPSGCSAAAAAMDFEDNQLRRSLRRWPGRNWVAWGAFIHTYIHTYIHIHTCIPTHVLALLNTYTYV